VILAEGVQYATPAVADELVAVGAVAFASQTSVGKAIIQEIGSTVKEKGEGQTITAHMRKYYESTML
jgi:hypothetical protein